jgi:hypothetical protein
MTWARRCCLAGDHSALTPALSFELGGSAVCELSHQPIPAGFFLQRDFAEVVPLRSAALFV